MQPYIGLEENFLLENGYLVARLEEIILTSENTRRFGAEDINEIFRIMHTIKSSAGIMMYDNIHALAHKLEDVFYYLRETYPENLSHEDLVSGILTAADFITAELVKIRSGEKADGDAEYIMQSADDFLARIKEGIRREGEELPPENIDTLPKQFYIAPVSDEASRYFRIGIHYRIGTEMCNVRAYTAVFALKEAAEEILYTPEAIITDEETAGVIMREGFHILLQTKNSMEEIRELLEGSSGVKNIDIIESTVEEFLLGFVDAEEDSLIIRLDDDWMPAEEEELIPGDYVIQKESGRGRRLKGNRSKLASAQEMVNIPLQKLDYLSELTHKLESFDGSPELSKLVENIREAVDSMQKVSMRNIFHKMNRALYDISRKQDKIVDLETIGEDTEIDRNITGLVSDSLMHIIRNAVDHGIEDRSERIKNGKKAGGKIILEAGITEKKAFISVSDDGRGMDLEKIYLKAKEKGILDGKEKEEITNADLCRIVTAPGFTTNSRVTEYSGRGVGLDVVMENLQAISGTLEIDSREGKGSKMTLWIPQRAPKRTDGS